MAEARSRNVLVAGILLMLIVAGGFVWFNWQDTDDQVGRTFETSVAVASHCQTFVARGDGLSFTAEENLPSEWRGATVEGTVEITGDHGPAELTGTFTGTDGRAVRIAGGENGHRFSPPACALWPRRG